MAKKKQGGLFGKLLKWTAIGFASIMVTGAMMNVFRDDEEEDKKQNGGNAGGTTVETETAFTVPEGYAFDKIYVSYTEGSGVSYMDNAAATIDWSDDFEILGVEVQTYYDCGSIGNMMGTVINLEISDFKESKTTGFLEAYYTGKLKGGHVENESIKDFDCYGTIKIMMDKTTKLLTATGTAYSLEDPTVSAEIIIDHSATLYYYVLKPTA